MNCILRRRSSLAKRKTSSDRASAVYCSTSMRQAPSRRPPLGCICPIQKAGRWSIRWKKRSDFPSWTAAMAERAGGVPPLPKRDGCSSNGIRQCVKIWNGSARIFLTFILKTSNRSLSISLTQIGSEKCWKTERYRTKHAPNTEVSTWSEQS